MFVVEADGLRVAHLGDLGHLPSDEQYRALGALDLLLLPVGGYYTIDGAQAAEVVNRLRPRIAVPMHYKTPWIDFPITDERPFISLVGGEYAPTDRLELSPAPAGAPARVVVLPYEPLGGGD
jgi:L-ascorbate metabolism protein UlaG (beta-lactamase superfamily)